MFVSYRRSDGGHPAGRLRDRLVDAFGEDNVFFDVDSIAFGRDFRRVIQEALRDVAVVLVVIGERWDVQRLEDAGDYVRIEIEEALRQKKLLVPVLVGGARMPQPDELPDTITDVAYRNAAPLRPDPDFHPDSDRIIDQISRATGFVSSERPGSSSQPDSGLSAHEPRQVQRAGDFPRRQGRRKMARSVLDYLRDDEVLQVVFAGSTFHPLAVVAVPVLGPGVVATVAALAVDESAAGGTWITAFVGLFIVAAVISNGSTRVVGVTNQRIIVFQATGTLRIKRLVDTRPRRTPLAVPTPRGSSTAINGLGRTVYVYRRYFDDLAVADARMPPS